MEDNSILSSIHCKGNIIALFNYSKIRGIFMKNFKFIYREDELTYAKEALENNNFAVYYYFDNSGLSHYLKKLQVELNQDKYICFYINSEKKENMAIQIAEQIISGSDQQQIIKYTRKNNEIVKHILKTLVTSVDIIPFINIGEIVNGLTEAINETLDVDIEHISDYKIEKAILNMLLKLEKQKKFKRIYFLIDDAGNLSSDSLDFLSKIMAINSSKILFTLPSNKNVNGYEVLSKLSYINSTPYEIKKVFDRPNERLICGLFSCYQKTYKEEYLNIFVRYERNIHIIMSYIRGFNMNFLQLNPHTQSILKILLILGTSINIQILQEVFYKINFNKNEIDNIIFKNFIKELENMGFITSDIKQDIYLNERMMLGCEIQISLIDRIIIARDIIDIFEEHIYELIEPQLKFVIKNLDKDYSRRKSYILILLDKQKKLGKVEQQYLDMLFYLDNKNDLFNICSMYYNLQVYDVPLIRLKQHTIFSEDRNYKILLALLQERQHQENYSQNLLNLIENSTNLDEKCLLIAIWFTALLNEGKTMDSMKILNSSEYEFYYNKFSQSYNYHYLLRNISYYIEEVHLGIDNYNACLYKFKNRDLVNYNRTISNFICYLMKHDDDGYAKIILKSTILEVEKILEFNDDKYLYLNINYGIYLMREDKGDPTKYFDAILSESGTTETPYIYAKVNHALYVSKKDPAKALLLLDEIYYSFIRNTKVIPTIIFYQINRILVEYMNGINNFGLLKEIRNNPLRGDKGSADRLYSYYSRRFGRQINYTDKDWKKLFLPGYIFYHGFNAELLLSTLDSPRLII